MSEDKSEQDLEKLYAKFLRLYEHIASDRVAINKQITQDRAVVVEQAKMLNEVIKELRAEISITADFKRQVQKDIVEVMQEVTDILMDKIEKELKEAVTAGINRSVNQINSSMIKFEKAINDGESLLKKYQKYELDNGLVRFVTICIAGIICALIACRFVMDKPYVRFDEDQAYIYSLGSKMDFIWRKLTKDEKQRFDVLYNEQEEEYRRELASSK